MFLPQKGLFSSGLVLKSYFTLLGVTVGVPIEEMINYELS